MRVVCSRYERLPGPEDLVLPPELAPEERARLMREADASFAASERALRAEMRRVRARRAADWPRLFDRDRDALPPVPPAAEEEEEEEGDGDGDNKNSSDADNRA
jgi:hypothetical protein